MTALLVFLLVGCGLAQSAIVSKCQLKEQLIETNPKLTHIFREDVEKTKAKIICCVELTSGFNTSLVQKKNIDNSIWTLYGIFQLSNHLTCNDGQTTTLNKCGKNCADFLDSDISDDATCFLETLNNLIKQGFTEPNWKQLGTMASMFFSHPECEEKDPSEYFSDCR